MRRFTARCKLKTSLCNNVNSCLSGFVLSYTCVHPYMQIFAAMWQSVILQKGTAAQMILLPLPASDYKPADHHELITGCLLFLLCVTAFTAGCVGIPSASPVTNGRPFTIACTNTPVNSACIGTCNNNFGGLPQYQVKCLPDANSPTGGSFSPTAEGICKQGG